MYIMTLYIGINVYKCIYTIYYLHVNFWTFLNPVPDTRYDVTIIIFYKNNIEAA